MWIVWLVFGDDSQRHKKVKLKNQRTFELAQKNHILMPFFLLLSDVRSQNLLLLP
jgi:hypothetical protein